MGYRKNKAGVVLHFYGTWGATDNDPKLITQLTQLNLEENGPL